MRVSLVLAGLGLGAALVLSGCSATSSSESSENAGGTSSPSAAASVPVDDANLPAGEGTPAPEGMEASSEAGESAEATEALPEPDPKIEAASKVCFDIVSAQMNAEDAASFAELAGVESRLVTVDGEPQASTKDYNPSRINFETSNDVVTNCFLG